MLGEPQKARVDIENADFTSNSELVLDLVMPYLPTRDCVRTSILSSKWKFRWTTVPSLVFDTTCCPHGSTLEYEGKALVNIVSCVLSLHNGSIQNFKFDGPCFAPDIDSWILRLSKASIKTLVLELYWGSVQYQIPSSLFACECLSSLKLVNCLLISPPSSFKGFKNLKCLELVNVGLTNDAFEKLVSSYPLLENLELDVLEQDNSVQYQLASSLFLCSGLGSLKLSNCLLSPPQSFEGFKHLKCLELDFVALTNDELEKLISSCPLLEELKLIEPKKASNLKINAPNLQQIEIFSDFVSISFGYAMTRLSVVCIKAQKCAYTSLLDFFIRLPNIQRLELKCCSMVYMPGNSVVGGFPFQCKDLYHLAISMDFSFMNYCGPSLYLYRSPSSFSELVKEDLHECYLAIELGEWQDNSKCHNQFEKLRSVNMGNYHGTWEELKLVEYVLENSPVLEKMTVDPHSANIRWKAARSIYEFERASSEVEIMFDGGVILL